MHTLNQNWVHVYGLGPWSDHLDISAPESSEMFGSQFSIELEGTEESALLSHREAAFIGIFRCEGFTVDILYSHQTTFSAQEKALPIHLT